MKRGYIMKYVTMLLLALLATSFSRADAQNKKTPVPNLNGKWISKNDPGYTLLVKNGSIYESHLHQKGADTAKYEITKSPCLPGKWNDKKSWFLQKTGKTPGDKYCYKLLSYSSNAFSMMAESNNTVYHFIRYLKRY